MTERVIRPSSLTGYADCARRWAAQHLREEVLVAGYDLRPPPPSNAGALVGSGVHAGAAYTLAHLRSGGAQPRIDDVHEQAIEGFRARMEAEGASWDDITDRPNTAERQIRRMVGSYYVEVAPRIRPVLIEERAEAEVAPGWVISGQADTLAEDAQQPLEAVVRDLKTGARARSHGPQLGAYSMLLAAHGHRPTRAQIDFIRRVPVAKPQPPAEEHPVDLASAQQDAWAVIRAILRDVAEWERRLAGPHGEDPRGAFLPNPASSLCSERYCPAFGSRFCSSHRR